MEKNENMDFAERTDDRWAEGRLAMLNPDSDWHPDGIRALAQLRRCRDTGVDHGRGWAIWSAAVIAIGLGVIALPQPRVLAYRCLDCSVALWKSLSTTHSVGAEATLKKNRKVAADFTLIDAAGIPIRLSDLKGKVVLLNFWATWCGGCQVEIPWFIEFEKKYRGSGFAVIGVSMDDDGWKSVMPYIKEKKINYSIGIGNKGLGSLYGLDSMPMTLLIDRSGRIASTHIGLVAKTDYQFEIEALLNEKSTAQVSIGEVHDHE